jgi:PAS domain S-box-containing protein
MAKHPPEEALTPRTSATDDGSTTAPMTDNTMVRQLSEDFIRLADRSQDAIYQFDIESRTFSFFNRKLVSLYAQEEDGKRVLSPKSVLLHIHPDDREKVKQAREIALQPGRDGGEVEYRLLADDGTVRVMHDRWTVVRDHRGAAVSIEGFIRDNTWRKAAEKDFEQSMRNSPIGCYIVQDAGLIYVNPEFLRITGYSEAELIGVNPLTLVQKKHRDKALANAIAMLKGKRLYPYEFCISDKEGRTKWILETATSIQYKGQRAALCYFMDISQGKQVEAERLAKEKLMSILELAGAVGHELNNPMQVVTTCAEKLAPGMGDDPRRAKLYDLLKNNLDRMVEIIHKFQNITGYATKDYVAGKKIFDIEAASTGKANDTTAAGD